jgi:spore germination cell wall hydrolase CwlJ-like protein
MLKKIILSTILLLPTITHAQNSQVKCLADIIYSEARGENKTGMIAIAHASLNRSKRSGLPVCHIKGVTRKAPNKALKPFFYNLARLSLHTHSTIGTADSWNVHKIPHDRGKKVKTIGRHVFYIMSKL